MSAYNSTIILKAEVLRLLSGLESKSSEIYLRKCKASNRILR